MKKILIILSVIFGAFSPTFAVLKVNVNQGRVAPTPIAVTPTFVESYGIDEIAYKMTQVIEADLDRCGLFKPIDQKSFIQEASSLRKAPRFEDWRLIKAKLLTVSFLTINQGNLTLTLKLFDVLTGMEMGTYSVEDTQNHWRKMAHKIADEIYQRVTGELGYFSTKIVYVAESGSNRNPIRKLAIIDQDGANFRALTDGSRSISLPVFSPTSQMIAYAAYHSDEQAKIYLMNVETGKSQLFVDQSRGNGIAFSPRFSSDGSKLIFSIAKGGTTSLYTKAISGGDITRLTRNIGAIDTHPCYSPDGTKIVFESDMGSKKRHLYTMNADGSNIKKISNGEGSYADPAWSPRGDLIACLKMYKGVFYICVMKPDGSGERLIDKGYQLELPTWSPNGRVLLYKKQGKFDSRGNTVKRIYSIDLTGYHGREIPTSTNAEMPAWSPVIR